MPQRIRHGSTRAFLRGATALTLASLLVGGLPDPVAAGPPVVESPAPRQFVGIRQGDRGAEVKAVQQALIEKGITVAGGADGVFGPATRSAVTTFQAQQGLAQTGLVDDATARALGLVDGGGSTTGGALLSQGATGPEVTDVQRRLISAGVYVAGGADGIWGPATTRAVTNYQRWNGLTVTGTLTAQTATALGVGQPAPDPIPTRLPIRRRRLIRSPTRRRRRRTRTSGSSRATAAARSKSCSRP